jgi:hypothetical protein
MAKVRVTVIEREGEFVVEPPIAILSFNGSAANADKLKIFNTTTEDLIFRIESAVPFGAQPQLKVIRTGDAFTWTVDVGSVDGRYTYQIFMTKAGKKAKGNSDPAILIDN